MTGLSPEHGAELAASVIAPEIAAARGYVTLGPEHVQTLKDMGCPGWAIRDRSAFPGLFIPMHDVRGQFASFQFKPAVPQLKPGKDKPVKYATPAGTGNRLDINPAIRHLVADPSQPLWITEGMKKADSLAGRGSGRAVIGMTGVYNWRRSDGMLADWEDIPLRGRVVVVCFDSDTVTNPQVRNAMRRLVAWLRSRQTAAVHFLVVPSAVGEIPVKGVDDYFAAGGTDEALAAAATERAPQAPADRDAAFTDAFLTDTVCAEALAGTFLFARGLGWMRYTGVRWTEADESAVVEEVRQWAKGHWEDVVEEYKHDQSREVDARIKGWRAVLNTAGRMKSLASLARGPLRADLTEFDAHPDLLNTPNGVVDLRTGELMEPDPDYRFTKVTGVPYDPMAADDPDFKAALDCLPPDVQGWYQVRIGQAFTGWMPPDDRMIVQQGGGENGKSTLAVPLSRAAGDYQVLVSERVIMGSPDQHPTELMDFKGARYALMEETPEARTLDVQRLKRIVGTPQIKARRMRQDPVTFDATHALFVNTNFIPSVAETDHATWRRLSLVKFPYTFRRRAEDVTGPMDRLGDPTLRDRCKVNPGPAMAALVWAVQGAVTWYGAGQVFGDLPQRVVDDTADWRREGDLILNFAQDRLTFEDGARAGTEEMFQAFGQWLMPQGHKPWAQKTFNSRFGGHDQVTGNRVTRGKGRTGGRYWDGVRINPVSGTASAPNPFVVPGPHTQQ